MKYFSLISNLVNAIPESLLRPFATVVAKGLVIFLKREREIAKAQIKFALGTTSYKPILEDSYRNSILSVFEVLRLEKIFKSSLTKTKPQTIAAKMGAVSFENTEIVNELLANDQAAICLGGHFSNFDLMTAYFSFQGTEMCVLARSANNKHVQEFVNQIRVNYGVKALLRNNKSTSTALLKAIKSNEIICGLIDQDVNLESKFVPFFGLDASHPIGPIKIALKFNMPILFVYCVRSRDNTFKIRMEKIDWQTANDPDPINYILKTYRDLLEDVIKKHPGQWVWWHRRWRRRPGVDYNLCPEKLLKTNDYITWMKGLGNSSKC